MIRPSRADPRADEQRFGKFPGSLTAGLAVRAGQTLLPAAHAGREFDASSEQRQFRGRPGPQMPGIAGLYLAGDWIGSEGYLLDASLASARAAAQLIVQNVAARPRVRATSLLQVA